MRTSTQIPTKHDFYAHLQDVSQVLNAPTSSLRQSAPLAPLPCPTSLNTCTKTRPLLLPSFVIILPLTITAFQFGDSCHEMQLPEECQSYNDSFSSCPPCALWWPVFKFIITCLPLGRHSTADISKPAAKLVNFFECHMLRSRPKSSGVLKS